MAFVLALDQGTTSSRAIVFDRRRHDPRRRRSGNSGRSFRSPGWVEHDADRDLGHRSRACCTRCWPRPASARATSRPSASPTSARPRSCGSARPASPIANAIVWQDRRTARHVRRAARRRACDRCIARKTGLVLDAYFSGTKLQLAARQRRRRPRPRRARRARLRHRRQLAGLAAHRRHGALHRCVEREPHAALQHPHRRVGRRAAARCSTVPRAVLPARGGVVRRLRAAHRIDGVRRAHRRHRRRPAGGALRPGLPDAGTGQEHLRHRLLPAAEHRRAGRRLDATTW